MVPRTGQATRTKRSTRNCFARSSSESSRSALISCSERPASARAVSASGGSGPSASSSPTSPPREWVSRCERRLGGQLLDGGFHASPPDSRSGCDG